MDQNVGKIGIAVITCNRQDFFEKCIASLPKVDYLVVVNDGKAYPKSAYPDCVDKVIQHSKNFNVAKSKNDGLRDLISNGCDHLFLCEDDIIVKDPQICQKYISTAAASGIFHLNYGGHGDGNREGDGSIRIRNEIDYDGTVVDFYKHCLGAWSYYLKGIVKHTGFMDERFNNAMEHVEHTYKIIQEGFYTLFWWFADAHDSHKMIEDVEDNHGGSTIRKNQTQWEHNMRNAFALFMHKHKKIPTTIEDTKEEKVVEVIDDLEKNYKKPEWITLSKPQKS